jgi:hypothetical protein
MAVFTFVVKHSGGTWTAKQHGGEADLEASSASTWELQRKLTNLALTSAGSGAVSSSFSLITPSSAVAQVKLKSCFLQNNSVRVSFMCSKRAFFAIEMPFQTLGFCIVIRHSPALPCF